MTVQKQTEVDKKETLSYEEREEFFDIGKTLYSKKTIFGAVTYFEKAYDESQTPDKINADAALFIAKIYRNMDDYLDDRLEWLKLSSNNGNARAAYELGNIYENGYSDDQDVYRQKIPSFLINKSKALKWYRKSADMGYPDAMYKCAEFFREGRGVLTSYKKAFNWMLKAACRKERYCIHLSQYFIEGVYEKKNIYEAYVWYLMPLESFYPERKKELAAMLIHDEVLQAQDEAVKRRTISEDFENPQALYEYMTQEVLTKKDKQKEKTEPESPPNPAQDPKAPIEEEPIITSDIEYNYVNDCKIGFDPQSVLIELVIEDQFEENEEIDFDSIVVSYKDAGRDKKPREVLNKYLQKRHRRFLIKLAIQFSKEKEKKKSAIKRIIQKCDRSSMISDLNTMFHDMFPGCHKQKQSTMIVRRDGKLRPDLKVDILKIIDSNDYKNWYNY